MLRNMHAQNSGGKTSRYRRHSEHSWMGKFPHSTNFTPLQKKKFRENVAAQKHNFFFTSISHLFSYFFQSNVFQSQFSHKSDASSANRARQHARSVRILSRFEVEFFNFNYLFISFYYYFFATRGRVRYKS